MNIKTHASAPILEFCVIVGLFDFIQWPIGNYSTIPKIRYGNAALLYVILIIVYQAINGQFHPNDIEDAVMRYING